MQINKSQTTQNFGDMAQVSSYKAMPMTIGSNRPSMAGDTLESGGAIAGTGVLGGLIDVR